MTDPLRERLTGGPANWAAINTALQAAADRIRDDAKGLNPYHLAAPLQHGGTYTCPVCGRPRQATPWPYRLAPFRRPDPKYAGRDGHAGCDRDVQRWTKTLDGVDTDPAYLAAQQSATDAATVAREAADRAWAEADQVRAAADDVWGARARALGPPDWFVDRAAARRRGLREDDDR